MALRIILAATAVMTVLCQPVGATNTLRSVVNSEGASVLKMRHRQMQFVTEAYKEAALKVLLEDVNRAANELKLSEAFPIQAEGLTEKMISSPFVSERAGMFGSVSTSNYHYYASQGNKLSYIVRNFGGSNQRKPSFYDALRQGHTLPKSQMDTNAAYRTAVGWLAAFGVDVKALERDSRIEIVAWDFGDYFVPVYYVGWRQSAATAQTDQDDSQTMAMVELFAPESLLLQMHVEKPEFIKRKPLEVPNSGALLQQTDDIQEREMWRTTDAYKNEALRIMLQEVNQVCQDLGLRKLPIQASNLTKVTIETPYVADHLGRFATIYTEDYIYGAIHGNKLSYINKSVRFKGEETKYLGSLKTRYAKPRSQMNTNSAYMMATQWLAAASVDLTALQTKCNVTIHAPSFGMRFVPLYTVIWTDSGGKVVATVEILEPERSLEKLWVESPEYLKRGSLTVPNREKLLKLTDTK